MPRIRSFLNAMLGRERLEAGMEAEMRAHMEACAKDLERAGVPREEALRRARLEFGSVERVKEECRQSRGLRWPDELRADVRYATRALGKSPAFTVTALLALGIGIGANTAVFSVVNAVLLRPLPYGEPSRLVRINETGRHGRSLVSPANFLDWVEQTHSWEGLASIAYSGATLTGGDEPEAIIGADVSPTLFQTLGVKPFLGRPFDPGEGGSGQSMPVILSHWLWQRRFGSNPRVIGTEVAVGVDGEAGEQRWRVIGVAPPGFWFPDRNAEYWVARPPAPVDRQRRGWHTLSAVGRLRRGVTIEQAQAEMDTIMRRLESDYPRSNAQQRAQLVPLREDFIGDTRLPLMILFGAVALVLLIACANVGNLLLARAHRRQREIAIRLALGAGRSRLVRQLLTESLLLGLAGAALGVAIARIALPLLMRLGPAELPRIGEVRVDTGSLAFAAALAVATALLAGLFPALGVSRPDLAVCMKEGVRMRVAKRLAGVRMRGALVVSQTALAVVLLIGAGLLVKSFLRRIDINLGYNPDNLVTVQLPFRALPRVDAILERVRSTPGVRSAAMATSLPDSPPRMSANYQVNDNPAEEGIAGGIVITPDYFRTMEIRLLKGRAFSDWDRQGGMPVAIINETIEKKTFQGEDPLGRRIQWAGNEWRTIVGVVADVRGFNVTRDPAPIVYLPRSAASNPPNIVVRTALPPSGMVAALRGEIHEVDPDLPVVGTSTMRELLSQTVASPRLYASMLGAFAAIALLLAALGTYAVVNYSVAQRTHEIGIRMALGSGRGDVIALVVRHAFALTLAGLLIGLAASWAATRVLSRMLFEVRPTDVATFVIAAFVLVAAGLLAGYLPAYRASKVDPVRAVRSE